MHAFRVRTRMLLIVEQFHSFQIKRDHYSSTLSFHVPRLWIISNSSRLVSSRFVFHKTRATFFPPPPSPRSTLVCPIPVSLTNAYREYVGNFDAPRSHQVSSPRCCENPIEVGTRHEEYFENISMARRGARKTRKTLSPPPQFRSFISLIR